MSGSLLLIKKFCGFVVSFINWAWPFSARESKMATGSSKPALPNTELDGKDLAELHKVLFPARIQYKSFGLQIGVGVDEIACIEKMNQDPGHCLLEILTARIRKSEPLTWNDIDAALREECVGLGSTANDIRKRYPHLFTPTASEHGHEKQVNFEKRDVKDAHHHHHEHTVTSEDILEEEQKGSDHQARMSKERERSSEYYEGMREGQDAKGKSTESSNKETYHKTRSKPPRKETEGRDGKREVVSGKKAKKATAPPLERDLPSSEMAQTDSGDGESDESSEDENELELQSSDEEEETENDSSTEKNEEKRSEKSRKSKEKATHPTTEMRKRKSQDDEIFRRVKGKKLSKAVGAPTKDDSHGDKEESDAGGSRDQKDQPKKRHRRRHRESSKSPIVRGGSSPSSSQEERKPGSRRQRRTPKHGGKYKRKEKKKRRETSSSSSDTDSSSPESEMLKNLTKSEKKKLRKVFKYSFGLLCSASFNPVETAVQLQTKGLISPGMMMDIIRSPEYQQENIIRLVCGLDNRIKSRPERLFGCIEVMLENDALQKVGREMLRETGKPFTHQAQSMFVMMRISSSLQV